MPVIGERETIQNINILRSIFLDLATLHKYFPTNKNWIMQPKLFWKRKFQVKFYFLRLVMFSVHS